MYKRIDGFEDDRFTARLLSSKFVFMEQKRLGLLLQLAVPARGYPSTFIRNSQGQARSRLRWQHSYHVTMIDLDATSPGTEGPQVP